MSANNRGGLKAAFTNFNRPDADKEAELKLLGRTVESSPATQLPTPHAPTPQAPKEDLPQSYQVATNGVAVAGGLTPRPLLQREVVRQLSFRCPVPLASELRRKAAFNQLEQQQIIIEGIKRVMAELPEPPEGWQE
jgi:hypothetical protein